MHIRCISRMRCTKHTDVPEAEQTRNLLQKPQKQAMKGTKAEKVSLNLSSVQFCVLTGLFTHTRK